MDGAKKKRVQAVVTLQLKRLFRLHTSGNALSFAYGFMTAVLFFTLFIALCSPATAPLWFSFFSSKTTTAPLAPTSSSLSSSSYALPYPNACATAKLTSYDHPNGNAEEKGFHFDDVDQKQAYPPTLLKAHDYENVSTPFGSYQQEPNTGSPIGVSGDEAVTTGESRLDALQPHDELEKLFEAADERYDISAREREILRQYRYGGNAFVVDDLKAESSPDSNHNMTSTSAGNLTGEINSTFSGNTFKDNLYRYGGNAFIDDLKTEKSLDGNGNMTSTPAANLTGETNAMFTGEDHKVVKGDLESEGSPDSDSNTTITPTVTIVRENGTSAGNISKVVKENDSDVPTKIQQVRSKRREGRREGRREASRRSGWRAKTATGSVGWRTKTGVNSEGAGSEKPKIAEPIGRERRKTECNIFDGRWVRDDSYPHYSAGSCPYVETPTSCYQNGRPDRNYEKWRWQPHGCNISRLDSKDMLERLRGKRLAFVGDSLNRNMWRSLICLLWSSLDDKTRMVGISGIREYGTSSATAFRFLDYNFTLEFFWSAFLVDEQQISHPNGTVRKKLRLDNIATFAPSYKDADILIFNSGHWWVPAKTNDGKNFYELGNSMYGFLEAERAYLRALMTWADWVDANVNPNKTRVFFRGFSNVHYSGGQWNSGGHCHKEVGPIMNDAYLSPKPREMWLAEIVLSKMKTPVTYLNITKLTDYRKDAHPSIYTSPKIVAEKFQDCSHWCLPGVPDTWNELLYATLIMKTQLDEAD